MHVEAVHLEGMVPRARGRLLRGLKRFILAKPLGALGLVFILLMVALALLAPVLAPYHPFATDSASRLQAPSATHYLGADQFGRDLYTRILFGARISLYVSLMSVVIGTGAGALLGLVSAYYGRLADLIIQRFVDIKLAIPGLVLALTIMAVLGPSINNVIIAVSIAFIPHAARVVRSVVLSVKERQHVDAARAVGCRDGRIMLFHVLPNCLAALIVLSTARLGSAILIEASLSFLGLGTPPPEPSWGLMLSGSAQYARIAPWVPIFPGVAITFAVFGFNLFGDALRDILDPRMRGTGRV